MNEKNKNEKNKNKKNNNKQTNTFWIFCFASRMTQSGSVEDTD